MIDAMEQDQTGYQIVLDGIHAQRPKRVLNQWIPPNLLAEVPVMLCQAYVERDGESERYLPSCYLSRALCRLVGQRALYAANIEHAKELGIKFEVVQKAKELL